MFACQSFARHAEHMYTLDASKVLLYGPERLVASKLLQDLLNMYVPV
ncbi:hypothetical protein E5Q_01244 [Mixia osmundae IAM 14324]|uniref:Uncharacterized protein n=1 Tax=Mixia osmundae (strain CBS 9802 / IAM 14324 / JCM 22182 / KY 12970) TaxID=764103 RepID=G7DVI2_MIXOS|nr:hypothetical protein E5Q_01244 [Mixia osmundae IAM 14324]